MSPSLAARDARLGRSLRAWARRASGRVEAKLSDARAHAGRAVTEALRATPDGRATLARARRSPSYAAALARLDELLADLAGPSVASLDGLIRDAREAFYVESFSEWLPHVPEAYWVRADPVPTVTGIRACRGAVLHGLDLRSDLHRVFLPQRASLASAVTLAGRRGATGRVAVGVLDRWHDAARGAIVRAVVRCLSDSQMDADTRSGRDLVHPDYLDDRPLAVGG